MEVLEFLGDWQDPVDHLLPVYVFELRSSKKGTNGKEVDAKKMSEDEWALWRDVDRQQWRGHLENGAMEFVHPDLVPPRSLLPMPLRFARVNKNKEDGVPIAKSRTMVPGHILDREDVRTDAPLAPPMIFHVFLWLVTTHPSWSMSTWLLQTTQRKHSWSERLVFIF